MKVGHNFNILNLLLFYTACLSHHPSETAADDTLTLHLNRQTTFNEVVTNLTEIHKSDKNFAKIETDQINIYEDNYCYERRRRLVCNRSPCSYYNRRVGICLRIRLILKNDSSFYMVLNDKGIFYSNTSTGNYQKIEGAHRGKDWYEDYIEEQLELRKRKVVCLDELPPISLTGERLKTASNRTLRGCFSSVCLSKSTLEQLWHVRISPFRKSMVWCLPPVDGNSSFSQELCASPLHVVRLGNGKSYTMEELCGDERRGCVTKIEQVSKALLFSQYIGDYEVTFVAARDKWVRDLLLCIQALIDVFVWIVLNRLVWLGFGLFLIQPVIRTSMKYKFS